MPLIERIDEADFPTSGRKWNGNDDSARNHNCPIPLSEDPMYLRLAWRSSSDAPARPLGQFRLHLAELRDAGYIRDESPGTVRVRFFHPESGGFFLQVNSKSPALLFAEE